MSGPVEAEKVTENTVIPNLINIEDNSEEDKLARSINSVPESNELKKEEINIVGGSFSKNPEAVKEYDVQVGLSGYATSIHADGYDYKFSGTSLSIGFARNFGVGHKLRFQAQYLNLESDTIEGYGSSYDLKDSGIDLTFKGLGAGASYSYFISEHFGIGGYLNYTFGNLRAEDSFGNYVQENCGLVDVGARIDFKVHAWNPYINFGYSSLIDSNGDSYSGANDYVGLLNFEF